MDDIIVVGSRYYAANATFWGSLGHATDSFQKTDYMGRQYSDGSEETPPAPAADKDEIKIFVNIDRPLTASEEAVLTKLRVEIAHKDKIIKSLPDDAYIILENGSTMTGWDIKQTWKNTDLI